MTDRAQPSRTNSVCDVLIIGSGAAGFACALNLQQKFKVLVVSKSSLNLNSTWLAQGGIASVSQKEDSFSAHIEDTLNCGVHLNNPEVVKTIVYSAPKILNWLVDLGMEFSRDKNNFHLNQEGGHQFRRIFHFEDSTGRALQNALLKNAKKRANITLKNHHFLLKLLKNEDQIIGAEFFAKNDATIHSIYAKKIIIASGGACNSYLYSSSFATATGDGLVAAYLLGAKVANLEFTQFHPTCFYNENARNLLLTEALRGEGAKLRLTNGKRFMLDYHPNAELAPRDVVARAIDFELKKSGENFVYLDISANKAQETKKHFPSIYKTLKKYGLDLTKDLIPVVPAAHYFCGGIMTNLDAKTNLKNLYAIGEVAHTGLHGANRLASNSLLECLIMGKRAAKNINNELDLKAKAIVLADDCPINTASLATEKVLIKHLWDQVRQIMSNYVGIFRTTKRLELAQNEIALIEKKLNLFQDQFEYDPDFHELINLTWVAKLSIKCALMRKESRGLHYNKDYPNLLDQAKDSILVIDKN